MNIRLLDIAHARSGDKGDTANVGLIALRPEWYPVLEKYVTRDAVTAHFAGQLTGDVVRFELPNLGALNFLLHGALDGGSIQCRVGDQGENLHGTSMSSPRGRLT